MLMRVRYLVVLNVSLLTNFRVGAMRLFVLSLIVGGLFISGYAQVANNVQKADRYRVTQDNIIITVSETHA